MTWRAFGDLSDWLSRLLIRVRGVDYLADGVGQTEEGHELAPRTFPTLGDRGALSVGSAKVYVVDELVERVDDHDRVSGVVVGRRQAIREGWLHRVAVTVCRDERGRILVHRRSGQLSRFPGLCEAVVGGAVDVGESYEQAAARELAEELGIRVLPRLLFTFLNRSDLRSHWLGVHQALVPDAVAADPDEVAWHGWLT
nr:hypothetical protein StreXyl84_77230 [Streptomyces sp. Xyl84]